MEQTIQALKPTLFYTIPIHNNPTGATLSPDRREALVALAAKHNFRIIADEVYQILGFSHEALEVTPLRRYDVDGNGDCVVSLGSFSKILAPGLRLGWVHASHRNLKKLKEVRVSVLFLRGNVCLKMPAYGRAWSSMHVPPPLPPLVQPRGGQQPSRCLQEITGSLEMTKYQDVAVPYWPKYLQTFVYPPPPRPYRGLVPTPPPPRRRRGGVTWQQGNSLLWGTSRFNFVRRVGGEHVVEPVGVQRRA